MSDPQLPGDNSDHEPPTKQPSGKFTLGLFVVLILWVISIATGTILFGNAQDWRKPLLVVAPMSLFLMLWAVLLLKKRASEPG